jgi:ankyrin repeat protein
MCREGRLFDVDRWISEGKPIQIHPQSIAKNTRPKTALQIALETGQHSLVFLLLSRGYQLALERYGPLDLALQARRWDLFDLLLQWGADLKSVDVHTLLNTYNTALYERFSAAGYDLTAGHKMASLLGHSSSNRPLLGFVKRHRTDDPKIQLELNIALNYQVKEGNERGVNLLLWAGADPHSSAPDPQISTSYDDTESPEEHSNGWSAIERAASEGHLDILKRLRPDPTRDDFDNLYRYGKYGSIITYLSTMQVPKDLTSILSWHLLWAANSLPWSIRTGTGAIEAVLACKIQWKENNHERIAEIRRLLLKLSDYDLRTIVSRLKRPDICATETYTELMRTPTIQARLLSLGLMKKVVSEREKQKEEFARLARRYDRTILYEQVWAQPVQEVAKSYSISGVMLGKVCRKLHVPVPPRGYWARIQNGYTAKKPPLTELRR